MSSRVSVDKLGYESLRPEQETVVREFFKTARMFLQLCLQATENRCVVLVCHTLLT